MTAQLIYFASFFNGNFPNRRRAALSSDRTVHTVSNLKSPPLQCTGVITGSIARIATRRYLSYSEADFDVFRLAGTTHSTDVVKFGMVPSPCQISPHRCNG